MLPPPPPPPPTPRDSSVVMTAAPAAVPAALHPTARVKPALARRPAHNFTAEACRKSAHKRALDRTRHTHDHSGHVASSLVRCRHLQRVMQLQCCNFAYHDSTHHRTVPAPHTPLLSPLPVLPAFPLPQWPLNCLLLKRFDLSLLRVATPTAGRGMREKVEERRWRRRCRSKQTCEGEGNNTKS